MPAPTPLDTRAALLTGLADALGFVLGALAGWQVGRLFGLDFIHASDWSLSSMLGLLPILVGCGLGRWLARWLAQRWTSRAEPQAKP